MREAYSVVGQIRFMRDDLCRPASKLEPGPQLDRSWTSREKTLRTPCGRLTEGWTDRSRVPDQVRMIDGIKDV